MGMEFEKQETGFDADLFGVCRKVVLRSADERETKDGTERIGIIYFVRDGGAVIQLETRRAESPTEFRKFYLSPMEVGFLYDELWDARIEGVI